MEKISKSKFYSEENSIQNDSSAQVKLFQLLKPSGCYDCNTFLLTIRILDTSEIKLKKSITHLDTFLVEINFDPDFWKTETKTSYKITGGFKIIKFGKNKIVIKQDLIIYNSEGEAKYAFDRKKIFIDYSPWN